MSCEWCERPNHFDKNGEMKLNTKTPLYFEDGNPEYNGWWVEGETGWCGTKIKYCPNCGGKLE